MVQIRTWILSLFLLAGVAGFLLPDRAHAATCDAIIGKWAWFIGGEVTVNRDGTFTQQSGNAGTWECNDGPSGRFTFRWRDGGFVNRLVLSSDGRGLTSTDPSQRYVTAQRSAPTQTPVPIAQKDNCCQETYACETKRIEAEFAKKMASCHFPGNSTCISEAISKKAAQLKTANEKLQSCNRAASGGVSRPATGVPAAGGASDEFHSSDGSGGVSQGCQPCGGESDSNQVPWGRRVKVEGDAWLVKSVGNCFGVFRAAARQSGYPGTWMRDELDTLDAKRPTSVTIRRAMLGQNEAKPKDPRKVTGEGTDATAYLDTIHPDQYILRDVSDVCGLLIHEMEHAMRMLEGTGSLRDCQLPGSLPEREISAMALENVYRKLTNKRPLEYYDGIRLPQGAINPTRVDFENATVPGWWCP